MTVAPLLDRGTEPRIGYLPGIDGLRAVSVVAVIAYHLELGWASGGFLGVEVFFVVSGYLITLLLLDEHRRTATVSRAAFWLRRARRLLPAVVVLLAAVVAWTAVAGRPGELHRFRGDALASLLYVQNWHAVVAEEPYFATFERPSPLRHLWSLAIEEQFYLLWPLLLPAGLRRLGRRPTILVALAAAVASAAAMASMADITAPERAYYGTDTRAFGILAGAALAFAWRPDRFRADIGRIPRHALTYGGAVALAALLWQLCRRSELDPWTHPWGFLVVDLATVALLVAVTHPASRLRRAVGSPLLAALGRRSYSLYLWHWPVIAFTRPGEDWPLQGAWALAARVALVVAASELSHRYVEQPFRDGAAQRWLWSLADRANARRLLAPSVAALCVALLGTVAVVAEADPPRASAVGAATPVTIALSGPTTTATTTSTPTTTSASPTTAVAVAPTTTAPPVPPPPRPVPDVTVVGESVTLGAAPALQQLLGPRVQVDAVEGRSYDDGIRVVELLSVSGRLTPTVVVHLGTNGIVPPGGLERIHAAVGPQRRLVLLTVRVDREWEAQVNDTVRAFAAGCATCAVVDWHATALQEPGLTTDDGVHLTAAGIERYTALVSAAAG